MSKGRTGFRGPGASLAYVQEAFCFQEHRGTGIRNGILEPQDHAWRLEGAASSCVGLGSLCEESLDVVEALTGRAL